MTPVHQRLTRLAAGRLSRLRSTEGQSIVEFAITLPLLLVICLGVVETAYALIDQHVVTKLAREGSNLISRDTSLERAVAVMSSMSTTPVNFNDGTSRVIFSVLMKGGTTGTSNLGQVILFQRTGVWILPGHEQADDGGPSRTADLLITRRAIPTATPGSRSPIWPTASSTSMAGSCM